MYDPNEKGSEAKVAPFMPRKKIVRVLQLDAYSSAAPWICERSLVNMKPSSLLTDSNIGLQPKSDVKAITEIDKLQIA